MFDPNMAFPNKETYDAWKFYWLRSGKTLEDAVEYGRQQGGDAYAERLKEDISAMEASESEPV